MTLEGHNKKEHFLILLSFSSRGSLARFFLSAWKAPFIQNNKLILIQMAKITVHGEEVFRAQRDQFAVAPTSAGYTVAYSANGEDFTEDTDAVVPADENLVYLGAMTYGYYKLLDNEDDVDVLV